MEASHSSKSRSTKWNGHLVKSAQNQTERVMIGALHTHTPLHVTSPALMHICMDQVCGRMRTYRVIGGSGKNAAAVPSAVFCRPLRPLLLLVSFPHSRSPVVGVLGLCWMWHGVPFAHQWRPVVAALGLCWLWLGSFDCSWCPHASVHWLSITCLATFPCA